RMSTFIATEATDRLRSEEPSSRPGRKKSSSSDTSALETGSGCHCRAMPGASPSRDGWFMKDKHREPGHQGENGYNPASRHFTERLAQPRRPAHSTAAMPRQDSSPISFSAHQTRRNYDVVSVRLALKFGCFTIACVRQHMGTIPHVKRSGYAEQR